MKWWRRIRDAGEAFWSVAVGGTYGTLRLRPGMRAAPQGAAIIGSDVFDDIAERLERLERHMGA